jgi:GAF domain-containing protein
MSEKSYTALQGALSIGGLHSGLAYLNSRVEHRFTAVYRLEKLMMRKIDLIDKAPDHLDTSGLQTVPLGDSFCQFALREGFFRTAKTTGMDDLKGHPYQGVIESYVGLPLVKVQGEVFGTLCHFDFAERPLSDDEFTFLQRVARLLPRYL